MHAGKVVVGVLTAGALARPAAAGPTGGVSRPPGAMTGEFAVRGGVAGDAAKDSRETALIFAITPVTAADLRWTWQIDALAAATTSSSSAPGAEDAAAAAVTSVAAHLGLAQPGCDALAVGGQLETRSDDRVLSAQQWATACPLGGNGTLSFDHRLEWDVSSRLLALPRLRPGVQRRETAGIEMVGSTVGEGGTDPTTAVATEPRRPRRGDLRIARPASAPGEAIIGGGEPERFTASEQGGRVRLEVQVGWTADAGGMADAAATTDVRIGFGGELQTLWRRYDDGGPDRAITVAIAQLDAMVHPGVEDGTSTASLAVDAVRIAALRWRALRLGGRIGGRVAAVSRGTAASGDGTLAFIGEGALSVERDVGAELVASAGFERRSWPAWDGRFVIDDRSTVGLALDRGRLRGRLELAGAVSHLLAADGSLRHVVTGGVTSYVELDVGAHITLAARSEAGRSTYAPGAAVDEPAWASEAMLLVALRAGNR